MTTETQQGASNVDIRAGNILSICSGIGGLDLGGHMASEDARTICYVEREAFAIASLVEAMEAGRLDQAPVWTDLRTFDGKAWRGVVDTLIGGIPCQPHSIAGLQRGEDDERDLWPDTARIIADAQPGRVFLENVPGIAPYYFERIGPDLRAMGYSVETGLFSASEVGASHQRQRFFILGHRDGESRDLLQRGLEQQSDRGIQDVAHRDGGQHEFAKQEVRSGRRTVNNGNGNVADAEQSRITGRNLGGLGAPGRQTVQQPDQQNAPDKPSDRDTNVADTKGIGRRGRGNETAQQTEGRCGDVADADEFSGRRSAERRNGHLHSVERESPQKGQVGADREHRVVESGGSAIPLFAPFRNDTDGLSRLLSEMPEAEPAVCGASYGSSNVFFLNEDRVDRLRSLGNMVVPLTGALAFVTLSRRVKE